MGPAPASWALGWYLLPRGEPLAPGIREPIWTTARSLPRAWGAVLPPPLTSISNACIVRTHSPLPSSKQAAASNHSKMLSRQTRQAEQPEVEEPGADAQPKGISRSPPWPSSCLGFAAQESKHRLMSPPSSPLMPNSALFLPAHLFNWTLRAGIPGHHTGHWASWGPLRSPLLEAKALGRSFLLSVALFPEPPALSSSASCCRSPVQPVAKPVCSHSGDTLTPVANVTEELSTVS